MIYLQLFWEFFKTGLFSVGGGLATLPFLYEMGERTGWFTAENVADLLAIAESTPGPIGVNMATYTGYLCGGIPGVLTACLGLVTPSFCIILLVAAFLNKFRRSRLVENAFYGLRPASMGLITAAGLSVAAIALLNLPLYADTMKLTDAVRWEAVMLAALIWVLTNCVAKTRKLHPIVFLGASAVVGIVLKF